jgi:hypothetical protein
MDERAGAEMRNTMKHIAMMMVSILLGLLTLLILISINGRSVRKMELQNSLSSVVEETLYTMAEEQEDAIDGQNAFLAALMGKLSVTLDSESEITVEVLKADVEKGILNIRVTEKFEYPNGKKGTVSCERIVILNKGEMQEPQMCQVKFYTAEDELYRSCTVQEGDVLAAPVNPLSENRTFGGWEDSNGYLADFTLPIAQDRSYYAVWN